ncbi:DNA primase [Stappia sp. F7233]|uniref:DNA primase n=1 Tax=Stappia albiluteola TaxID=2758565 RepID=A0A839AIG0_9HYPH|nr:DNA primase family protein [Stappia albiluteola]MBA5779513.1 DNA primase [Stappia albiluteola]
MNPEGEFVPEADEQIAGMLDAASGIADPNNLPPSQRPDDDKEADPKAIEMCAGLDASDTDNGKRLIAHFGRDLCVMAMDGSTGGDWLSWTGTHWDMAEGAARSQEMAKRVGDLIMLEADYLAMTPDEAAAVKAATEAGAPIDQISNPHRDLASFPEPWKPGAKAFKSLEGRKAKRRGFGVTSKNAGRVDNMLKMAASQLRRAVGDFNLDPHLVGTKTHTLKFRKVLDPECPDPDVDRYTYEMEATRGHRREDWLTAVVPVEWRGEDYPAPKWQAFLDRMMPDKDKLRTVQQMAGLGLLGVPIQKVMFHYGMGANGKSVFLETVARVIGPGLMVGLPRESIVGSGERGAGAASPDLVRLYGKRMVRVLEVPADVPLQEDLIKRLTGGEAFPVRTLFKGFFEFQSVATPHMSGNGFPTIDGTDNGIWRRMLVVHWDQTLPEEEQRDFEEMVGELVREDGPGILAWLARGALDYLRHGLFVADAIKAATDKYHGEMDPIGEFLSACVAPLSGARVQASTMYEAYKSWSDANAKRVRSNTKFGRVLGQRLAKETVSGRIFYENVTLRDVPERPTPNPYDQGGFAGANPQGW